MDITPVQPGSDDTPYLRRAAGLAGAQVRMAVEITAKMGSDARANSPEVLAAVIQAIATNYAAIKK